MSDEREQTQRAEFEAWVSKVPRPAYLRRLVDDSRYESMEIEWAWLAWQAARRTSPAPAVPTPQWIVNDLGELGVRVGGRFFFLYKGDNIEYGSQSPGGVALHDDGTPMLYRMVGKWEFGEVCYPAAFYRPGFRIPDRYTEELVYTPGLSFGKPEDGAWKPLPSRGDASAPEAQPSSANPDAPESAGGIAGWTEVGTVTSMVEGGVTWRTWPDHLPDGARLYVQRNDGVHGEVPRG